MTSACEPAPETEPLLHSGSPAPVDRSPSPSRSSRESSIRVKASRETSAMLRIAAAMYSFVVLGMLVSSLGVMVPRLEAEYNLSDAGVSIVFLVWPAGYAAAAWLNGPLHARLGQRGVAVVGPLFHVLLAAGASLRPPAFAALLAAFALGSLGTAVLDGSFCAWAGAVENANVVQGFLHGSYSAGAALGPFLAGTMLEVGHLPWYSWYYVLLGASVLEAIVLVFAFRFEDASKYRRNHEQDRLVTMQGESAADPTYSATFKHRVTWICSIYFLACVGTENAVSGWIVVFMMRVDHASAYLASLSSSGFWIGQAAGRLILGQVTQKVGVRSATIAYLVVALALEVLFAAIRIPEVSTAIITLLGFFLGPLFPSGVFVTARLLPRELHVGAISFAILFGQVGGALLPFALGSLADTLGIQIFQLVIFAQITVTLLVWLAFPRLPPPITAG
ncbi:MFS general substrate transporter [Hypoxylon sp. FL1284]|nr:MFS general substrate transporter [Hypoxylon sp. FL1284]